MIGVPTCITLFLAGVWHGAGMQFIIFGLLHAVYLSVNHAWRIVRGNRPQPLIFRNVIVHSISHAGGVLLTFAAVLLAQIFFRATGVQAALGMIAGLLGLHRGAANSGASTPSVAVAVLPLILGFVIVWVFPNTQQILARFKPAIEVSRADREESRPRWLWQPNVAWGFVLGGMLFAALVKMEVPTSFLYFQF